MSWVGYSTAGVEEAFPSGFSQVIGILQDIGLAFLGSVAYRISIVMRGHPSRGIKWLQHYWGTFKITLQ